MPDIPDDIARVVAYALEEDIGSGDLTAGLISDQAKARARVIAREAAILCGSPWFDEVFRQLDSNIKTSWHVTDGEPVKSNMAVCTLTGPARHILTGERTALNFLQTLSGTATTTHQYVTLIQGLDTKILDTRKTLPGLRKAQKYAVACGGGQNHRMGLYDAVLIKENHIIAAGSLQAAIESAKQLAIPVEIEVENLQQLDQALQAGADRILLDNFHPDNLRQAVDINQGRAILEASGGIDESMIRSIAETGVDYISMGALSKHLRAIDFSMRFIFDETTDI
jgi:nicotinate-nucleotide pyrophosphorylase (carboxylating)